MNKLTLLLSNLSYPEGPRWHDNKLWFSDIFVGELKTLDRHGNVDIIASHDGLISGTGWLPNGDLCAVSVFQHQLLRWKNGHLHPWVNIDDGHTFASNDMVISTNGHAYIGNISFDYTKNEALKPCNIKLVTLDGKMKIVATDMQVPNGMVITSDGKTLIAAESFGDCLTAFTIKDDGTLSNKKNWATLPKGAMPDGICLDQAGCIWAACNQLHAVLRINPGGEIIESIDLTAYPLACMLGGSDHKTLFILTTTTFDPVEAKENRGGNIYSIEIAVPGETS